MKEVLETSRMKMNIEKRKLFRTCESNRRKRRGQIEEKLWLENRRHTSTDQSTKDYLQATRTKLLRGFKDITREDKIKSEEYEKQLQIRWWGHYRC